MLRLDSRSSPRTMIRRLMIEASLQQLSNPLKRHSKNFGSLTKRHTEIFGQKARRFARCIAGTLESLVRFASKLPSLIERRLDNLRHGDAHGDIDVIELLVEPYRKRLAGVLLHVGQAL